MAHLSRATCKNGARGQREAYSTTLSPHCQSHCCGLGHTRHERRFDDGQHISSKQLSVVPSYVNAPKQWVQATLFGLQPQYRVSGADFFGPAQTTPAPTPAQPYGRPRLYARRLQASRREPPRLGWTAVAVAGHPVRPGSMQPPIFTPACIGLVATLPGVLPAAGRATVACKVCAD